MKKETTMRTIVTSLLCLVGVALTPIAGLQFAHADEYVWSGPTGAYFDVPANWTPTGPPGSADTAAFSGGGNFDVYIREPLTTNKLLKIEDTYVTLVLTAMTGEDCWDPATYELLGSGSMLKTAAIVGNTPGERGTLRLLGALSHCNPPGYVDADGMLTIAQTVGSEGRVKFGEEYYGYEGPITWTSSYPTLVGLNGTGTLEIREQHELINSSAVIGQAASADGEADIFGTWTNNGTLTVGQGGHGDIFLYGELTNTGNAYIGAEPGASGIVNVRENGSLTGSWICDGLLVVGGSDQGAGGEGSIWVGGGYLHVGQDTIVWSSGSIEMDSGEIDADDIHLRSGGEITVGDGQFDGAELNIFNGGTLAANGGTVALTNVNSAGTIDVNGGTLTVSGPLYNGSSSDVSLSASGTINAGSLTGNGSTWNWTSGALNITDDSLNVDVNEPLGADLQIVGHKSLSVSNSLNVGPNSSGVLTVASGATAESGAGVVGSASGTGSATLTGDNTSWTIANTLTVGGTNPAQLSVNDGATVSNQDAYLASGAGSTAQVSLASYGTQWNCGGSLYAGGDSTAARGTGTLDINTGAHLNVAGTLKVWDDFSVTIDDGMILTPHLAITGEVAVLNSGILDLSGGPIDIMNGGTLNGAIVGDASTPVALYDAGSTWSMPGSLLIGASDYGSGHIHALSLQPGTTVTVEETVTAQNILAMTLGGGVINADLVNLLNADFNDFGTINGKFLTTGSVTATGDLVLGDINSNSGVQIGGALNVGPHHVTLNRQGQVFIADSTSIAGGTLTMPNGFLLTSSLQANGLGVIDTPDDPAIWLLNDGSILGNSASERIELTGYVRGFGTLNNVTISGTDDIGYDNDGAATVNRGSINYAGRLVIELGGLIAGTEHDQINHSGTAGFAGELAVELVNGFEPQAGDSFMILTYGGHTGQFETLTLPALAGDLSWEVRYGRSALTLAVVQQSLCVGDLDGDGVTGQSDLGILLSAWGINDNGDLDGDGATGQTDLGILLADWGCGL